MCVQPIVKLSHVFQRLNIKKKKKIRIMSVSYEKKSCVISYCAYLQN